MLQCHKIKPTKILLILVLFVITLPTHSWATSASISVSGNEGRITIAAEASFTTHIFCNHKDPPDCWPNNSGSLSVSRNGRRIGSKGGKGSASWSTDANAAVWSQGNYTLQIRAYAANGERTDALLPITIDNTPVPKILTTTCTPDKTCDVVGTIDFKENPAFEEGSAVIYIKILEGSSPRFRRYGSKLYFEGTHASWRYSDFTGSRMSQATWGNREIIFKITATAANGVSASDEKDPTIPGLACPFP